MTTQDLKTTPEGQLQMQQDVIKDREARLAQAITEGDERKARATEHVLQGLRRQHEHLQAACDAFRQYGCGTILRHNSDDRWIILLPDASEPGKFRHQTFTRDSFSGHMTFDSIGEAVLDAASCGYTISDQNALDRLSREPEWERGVRYLETVRKLGRREISMDEANIEIADAQEDFTNAIHDKIADDDELMCALMGYMSGDDVSSIETPALNDRLKAYMERLPRVRRDAPLNAFRRAQPIGAPPQARGWQSWSVSGSERHFTRAQVETEVLERTTGQGLDLERLGQRYGKKIGQAIQFGTQGEWLLLNDVAGPLRMVGLLSGQQILDAINDRKDSEYTDPTP